jgi:uncharacterized membrane protein YfcA
LIITMIFLCTAGFIAAFVDSIAGGGGLISLPALLLAGVPAQFSLGTNKFASSTASFTSSLKYIKSGNVNFKVLKFLVPCTLLGASLGVSVVLLINQKFLYTLVLILVLFVGIYSLFAKNIGKEDLFQGLTKKSIILGGMLAFGLGFYDGFFGPGTGSFLIFGLIGIYKFNFLMAGGNARILNFVSNITALILFAINGKIKYLYGIPFAIAMIFGARLGTSFALNHGTKLIKPIFITMSLAVAAKMLFNLAWPYLIHVF